MSLTFRSVALALLALFFVATSSHAAPNPKITDWKIANEQLVVTIKDEMGAKQVIAESSGMKNHFSSPEAMIVGGGYAIIYQAPGVTGGGFEGENHAVKHFDIYGTKKTLFDKPLRVQRLREVRTTKGYPLYVVSMQDGGAGIPHLYLVDKMKGEIWSKGAARMTGARSGKLIVALYPEGEEAGYEDAKPIGTTYLDLDRIVSNMLGLS